MRSARGDLGSSSPLCPVDFRPLRWSQRCRPTCSPPDTSPNLLSRRGVALALVLSFPLRPLSVPLALSWASRAVGCRSFGLCLCLPFHRAHVAKEDLVVQIHFVPRENHVGRQGRHKSSECGTDTSDCLCLSETGGSGGMVPPCGA